jgi:hypothetical protein
MPSESSSRLDLDPVCRCGHALHSHEIGLADPNCRACPGDEERSWRHAFTPAEPEIGTCVRPDGCKRPLANDCEYGCRDAADELTRLRQKTEASDCWACKHPEHRAFNCSEQLDGDDCYCGANAPEPEAPECRDAEGCHRVQPCDPGCAAASRQLHEQLARAADPPRRPPYAVAYALEGGAQYEIALPGDATVTAVDGVLTISHPSAVLALTQTRPMEGA